MDSVSAECLQIIYDTYHSWLKNPEPGLFCNLALRRMFKGFAQLKRPARNRIERRMTAPPLSNQNLPGRI